MALPTSTANWHWKNKNVTPWAKSWFERELTTITVTGEGDETVSIISVTEVDGDVELGQRKSKLITIYDCRVEMKWSGTASDGTAVEGRLTIPEVSHENTLDKSSDYVYEWSLTTSSSAAVDALFKLAKSRLPVALETKFAEFPVILVDTHGKDLQVGITPEPSRGSTPVPNGSATLAPAASSSSANASKSTKATEAKSINTSTVTVEATFMARADDLFSLLTDEKRIPTWSRAAAKSTPEPGSQYSLFGGGVLGQYVSLDPPKTIVQTWALSNPSWPSGHEAILTTTFDQTEDSTKVTYSLKGVPVGQEDQIRHNLEGYYVQGLKAIGYVRLIPAPVSRRRLSASTERRGPTNQPSSLNRAMAILFTLIALAAAFYIPLSRK